MTSYKTASTRSVSNNPRPRTPPSKSRHGVRDPKSPPSRPEALHSMSPLARKTQNSFLSQDDYTLGREDENDDDHGHDLEEEGYEDEFGLPSITSMKRNGKRAPIKRNRDSNGSLNLQRTYNSSSPLTAWRTSSGDIAEVRDLPSYPTTKRAGAKILRPQYKEILTDPANSLHLISHPTIPTNATSKDIEAHSARITRINKFKRILQASTVSLSELRDSAWSGLPTEVRAMSWQLLLGYLPTSSERRVTTLERKRKEYLEGVRQTFGQGTAASEAQSGVGTSRAASTSNHYRGRARGLDEGIWHQISIDVPRTNPHLELYSYEATQRSLERILYLWAIRHPASGYVQGINDLVTPFWQVFLGTYITDPNIEFGMDPGQLPKPVLDAVEADSFWCLTKLLDGIQDNYIHAQPGIQRQVGALRDRTTRIDSGLTKHLEKEGIEFIQFSFRWMNCLLMRELSVKNTIRMWDTYMAEEHGFSEFHLYVCAAFLVKWSEPLMKMDFQETMMFLQALPTRDWTDKDIELLLSEAFIWQSLFRGSSAHLRSTSATPASQNG